MVRKNSFTLSLHSGLVKITGANSRVFPDACKKTGKTSLSPCPLRTTLGMVASPGYLPGSPGSQIKRPVNPIHAGIQQETALPTVSKALCRWDIGGGEILASSRLSEAGMDSWCIQLFCIEVQALANYSSYVHAQLCPTLQHHDCSPPGSSVHGIS